MQFLEAIQTNLTSPAILFFVLGVVAAVVKTDLRFPEPLYLGLTMYLLVAIGFKGGVADIEEFGNIQIEVIVPAPVAEQLLERLNRDILPHFAVIVYETEVRVLRPDKF